MPTKEYGRSNQLNEATPWISGHDPALSIRQVLFLHCLLVALIRIGDSVIVCLGVLSFLRFCEAGARRRSRSFSRRKQFIFSSLKSWRSSQGSKNKMFYFVLSGSRESLDGRS